MVALEGAKSCRIQGESVRPSVCPYIRPYVSMSPPEAPQRPAEASKKLVEASQRPAQASQGPQAAYEESLPTLGWPLNGLG